MTGDSVTRVTDEAFRDASYEVSKPIVITTPAYWQVHGLVRDAVDHNIRNMLANVSESISGESFIVSWS